MTERERERTVMAFLHCRAFTSWGFRSFVASLIAISVFLQLATYSRRLQGVNKDFIQPSVMVESSNQHRSVSKVDVGEALAPTKDRALSQEALIQAVDEILAIQNRSDGKPATPETNKPGNNGSGGESQPLYKNPRRNRTMNEVFVSFKGRETRGKPATPATSKTGRKAPKRPKKKLQRQLVYPTPRVIARRPDGLVQVLKEQLSKAETYLGIATKESNYRYIRELKQVIEENRRMLGQCLVDADLPKNATEKARAVSEVLYKFRNRPPRCNASVKSLTSVVVSAEEASRAAKMEKRNMAQILLSSLPKGLHCLGLRLTLEYYRSYRGREALPDNAKLEDPQLHHYAIFTSNILAASVVVNSTICHAKEPDKHVFHILTDSFNYPAMKMWFLQNTPRNSTVEVKNASDLKWVTSSYLSSLSGAQLSSGEKISSKEGSVLNALLMFYLPDIFPKLNKILLLKDDVVIHKDLARMWDANLHGKACGVPSLCAKRLSGLETNRKISSEEEFVSTFGMLLFDLQEWKKKNMTRSYHLWQDRKKDDASPYDFFWIHNETQPLGKSWPVLCLGLVAGNEEKLDNMNSAAYIQYYGQFKPWLQISGNGRKGLWTKFMSYDHPFMQECHVRI